MLLYVASSSDRGFLLEKLADAAVGGTAIEEICRLDELGGPPSSMQLSGAELITGDDTGDFEPDATAAVPEIVLDSGEVVSPRTPIRITPEGREMLFVAFSTERWLANAPSGPLELGTRGAATALATLVCNWSTTVIHTLAAGPWSFSQLHMILEGKVTLSMLEEHLGALLGTGMIEEQPTPRGGVRYAATPWLREGIAPLAAAMRLERHFPEPDTRPPDRLDVAAAFQLALSDLTLPPDLSGRCRFVVELDEEYTGEEGGLGGVTATIQQGRTTACERELDDSVVAWARATTLGWLDTLVDPSEQLIDTGGDSILSGAAVAGLHHRLFGIPTF